MLVFKAFLRNPDRRSFADSMPRQSDHQRLQLFSGQRYTRARFRLAPDHCALVQAPRAQPNPKAIVNQHLHPRGPSVGKQIGVMRTRLTEHPDDSRKRGVRAGAHVQRLNRHPHRIDPNHLSNSRSKTPDSLTKAAGRLIAIDTLPFLISMRIGSCLLSDLLSATGTNCPAIV